MVGREVLLRVEKTPAAAGRRRCSRSRTCTSSTTAASRRCAASRSRCAPARSSASPASTATGRRELIDAITGLRTHRERHDRGRRAGRCTHATPRDDARRRRRPHPRGPAAARARPRVLASPRTSRCTTTAKRAGLARWAGCSRAGWSSRAARLIQEFDVRGGGPLDARGRRSRAGTSRRSSLAREIERDPKVLIAAQPTRGLDVGAIEFVHRRLVAERDEGRGVLLVSLELEEIFSLSDRILVMYEGEIAGEHAGDVSEEQIGLEMTRRRPGDGRRRDRRSIRRTAPPEPPTRRRRHADARRRASRSSSAPAASIVPVLTALLAFLIGGLVVLATGHNPLLAYRDIFNGTGLNWIFHPTTSVANTAAYNLSADAAADDAADPLRARGRVRVPLRHVQHRRPGPVLRRPLRRQLVSAHSFAGMAGAAAHPARGRRRDARRRGWAGIAGFLKATVGAHEVISTIMLNWIAIWVGEWLLRRRRPARRTRRTRRADLERHRRQRAAAGLLGRAAAAGAPRRLLHRARRARRLLADPQPHDARLRGARGRLQPGGGRATAASASSKNYFLAMAISGAFAGLAGRARHARLAVPLSATSDIPVSSVGFLGIAVALLGRNTAVGVGLSRAALRRAARSGRRTACSIRTSSTRSSPAT